MDAKGHGMKRTWSHYRSYSGICLEGVRKTTRNISRVSTYPGRDTCFVIELQAVVNVV
jgi:hypothetical protein